MTGSAWFSILLRWFGVSWVEGWRNFWSTCQKALPWICLNAADLDFEGSVKCLVVAVIGRLGKELMWKFWPQDLRGDLEDTLRIRRVIYSTSQITMINVFCRMVVQIPWISMYLSQYGQFQILQYNSFYFVYLPNLHWHQVMLRGDVYPWRSFVFPEKSAVFEQGFSWVRRKILVNQMEVTWPPWKR